MAALVSQAELPNVPRAQTDLTRLKAGKILERVAAVYGLSLTAVTARRHQEAYQIAVWLLRRVGPLWSLAIARL